MPCRRSVLFTPRFFLMCGFTFTVFLSAFQLLPTAPFHILDLGGSTFASGLFLGFLTYSSAFSAPLTGALADRVGQRRVLIIIEPRAGDLLAGLRGHHRLSRAARRSCVVHGVFWSGLLSASAAYMTDMLPERTPRGGHRLLGTVDAWRRLPWRRRSVSGSTVRAGCGCACRRRVLNLVMAAIAWGLTEHATPAPSTSAPRRDHGGLLEWRVLSSRSRLFLYSFGYGGITSFTALYADANGVTPKSIYLTALAIVILLTRPMSGRLGDSWGYKRVFIPASS